MSMQKMMRSSLTPAVRAALAPPYQFNAIDQRSALKIDFWMLRPNPFEMSMFQRRLSVNF